MGSWEAIPMELKRSVVKYMDFRSRTEFRQSNRLMKLLVDETPFQIEGISFIREFDYGSQIDMIRFVIAETTEVVNNYTTYSFHFKNDSENHNSLEKYENNDLISEKNLGGNCHLREAYKAFKRILMIPNIRFRQVTLKAELDFPIDFQGQIHAQIVNISQNFQWFSKLAPNAERLIVYNNREVNFQFCQTIQFKTAKDIYLDIPNQNCGDEISEFCAQRIQFCSLNLSNRVINLFLRKLYNDEFGLQSDLKLLFMADENSNLTEIAEGFDIISREESKYRIEFRNQRMLEIELGYAGLDTVFTAKFVQF